jgi:hypothetical protein
MSPKHLLIAIITALVAADLIASIVVAANHFNGGCESGIGYPIVYSCGFLGYYVSQTNLMTNAFLNPLALLGVILGLRPL